MSYVIYLYVMYTDVQRNGKSPFLQCIHLALLLNFAVLIEIVLQFVNEGLVKTSVADPVKNNPDLDQDSYSTKVFLMIKFCLK